MYKRESLFNTTFSDTLHLNVNTNAQTMSHDINDNSMNINNNYFIPDDLPPDPFLQLNQTLETMCLRQDIATCMEEGADASNQASIICSSVRPGARIRRLLYHPLYPSACWSTPPLVDGNQCPPPVLNQTLVDAIQVHHFYLYFICILNR